MRPCTYAHIQPCIKEVWMNTYADLNGLTIRERKSGKDRFIKFSKIEGGTNEQEFQ